MIHQYIDIYKKINSSLFYLVINCWEKERKDRYVSHKYDLENICLSSVNISRLSVFVRGDNNFNEDICLLKNMQLQTDSFLNFEIFMFVFDRHWKQAESLSEEAWQSIRLYLYDDVPFPFPFLSDSHQGLES